MLLFNFGLTIICFWILFILHRKYLRLARINHFRFRLYALRDELCILAMRGRISPESAEFRALMSMMNTSAHNLDRFNVADFIKSLDKFRRDKQMQAEFTKALLGGNEDYKRIYSDVIETIRGVLRRELYFLSIFLSLVIRVLMTISVFKRALSYYQDRSAVIVDLDSWLANPVPVSSQDHPFS